MSVRSFQRNMKRIRHAGHVMQWRRNAFNVFQQWIRKQQRASQAAGGNEPTEISDNKADE